MGQIANQMALELFFKIKERIKEKRSKNKTIKTMVQRNRQLWSWQRSWADMKKKIIILLSVVIILLMGIVVWFNIPLDLMDLDPNEVMEIVVFNGNSGNATHITDKEQIQHIVENLNGVEVKRSKPSLGYMGYSFKVTIYLSDGNEAGDWNNFIINSDDTIRKDPFFYSVTKGNIDYSYIEGIVE